MTLTTQKHRKRDAREGHLSRAKEVIMQKTALPLNAASFAVVAGHTA